MWNADFCTNGSHSPLPGGEYWKYFLASRFKDKYTTVSELAYLLLKSAWPSIQFQMLKLYYFQTVVYWGFFMEFPNKMRSTWDQRPQLSPLWTDSPAQTHTKVVWKVCRLLATRPTFVLRIHIAPNISCYFTSVFHKGGIFKNARITFSPKAFLIF